MVDAYLSSTVIQADKPPILIPRTTLSATPSSGIRKCFDAVVLRPTTLPLTVYGGSRYVVLLWTFLYDCRRCRAGIDEDAAYHHRRFVLLCLHKCIMAHTHTHMADVVRVHVLLSPRRWTVELSLGNGTRPLSHRFGRVGEFAHTL